MLAHMEHTVEFSHVRFTKIKSGLTFIINFKLSSAVMESGTTVLVFLTPDETHGKEKKKNVSLVIASNPSRSNHNKIIGFLLTLSSETRGHRGDFKVWGEKKMIKKGNFFLCMYSLTLL